MLPKIKTVQDLQKLLLKIFLLLLMLFFSLIVFSQISLNTIGVLVLMDFNTNAIGNNVNCTESAQTWTNNLTIPNCYSNRTTYFRSRGCHNSGGLHVYGPDASTERALGARGSSSVATIEYGVRYINNTGSTITSLNISFRNEHWGNANPSVANHALNVHTFSYRVSASAITNLTGAYTTGPSSLNVTPVQNTDGFAGSSMTAINGNTFFVIKSGCIDVTIPNGSEIMLKWTETDNGNNDHNMGIDDLTVRANAISCNDVFLPITLASFTGKELTSASNLLEWTTSSEINNDFFTLERSTDAVNFESIATIKGAGNSNKILNYNFIDATLNLEYQTLNTHYYRLKQTDFDGQFEYFDVIAISRKNNSELTAFYFNKQLTINVFDTRELPTVKILDVTGRVVYETSFENKSVNLSFLARGIYIYQITHQKEILSDKFIVN